MCHLANATTHASRVFGAGVTTTAAAQMTARFIGICSASFFQAASLSTSLHRREVLL